MPSWYTDTLDDALWPIRALRAGPPGRATSGRRDKVFQAATEQFEQLLRSAHLSPPATAPILMYYALSQAGRAILAAFGEKDSWAVHGHGLGADTRDPIGNTIVRAHDTGLFRAVAATTGSDGLNDPVTLSEIWGAVPQFDAAPGLGDKAPPIFYASGESAQLVVRSREGAPIRGDEFESNLHLYPGAADASWGETVFTGDPYSGCKIYSLESFSSENSEREFFEGLVPFPGGRFLRAPLGQTGDQPSGLMTVWIILLALSSLARYEPAAWTSALDARSLLAVPLEETLSNLPVLVAKLVLAALAGRPDPYDLSPPV